MCALVAALLLSLTLAGPSADAADGTPPATVRVHDYDLGDAAYRVGNFHAMRPDGYPARRLAPLELAGRVYAPADAAGRHLPLVVLAHGLFWSCANDATGKTTGDWPCRGGATAIRSDRGYDYLGQRLAARGMVVISISANGVNAGELGQVADRARASLVFEHLRLWRELVETGTGPLVGAFTDAATGLPADPALRGAADFGDVGLLGHSRGGRGMMWAAAEKHRDRVPPGVTIRAVFGLAAAGPAFMDRRRAAGYTVAGVPVMTWSGTCDATGRDEYNVLSRRRHNPDNVSITVHGANHNDLNSRWSAQSGLPGAEDDAAHPPGRPGRCLRNDAPGRDRTLGYDAEQSVAATYVEAFFARHLQGDTSFDDVLSGERKPLGRLAEVDLRRW